MSSFSSSDTGTSTEAVTKKTVTADTGTGIEALIPNRRMADIATASEANNVFLASISTTVISFKSKWVATLNDMRFNGVFGNRWSATIFKDED